MLNVFLMILMREIQPPDLAVLIVKHAGWFAINGRRKPANTQRT